MQVKKTTCNNQNGQASVFVLAFIGIILICTIFLYQSGRITSEKMQLQNAADAAAFGASTLEARSLNFSAYTNRAMVANEVAVGQMVGMLSFVDELKTTGEYIEEYAAGLEAATAWLFLVITVGDIVEGIITAIVEVMETIGEILVDAGETAEESMEIVISPLIRGMSIINTVYSVSQTAYHGATIYLVTTNILQSLEDNVPGTTPFKVKNIFDPDKPGAHLSDFGVLALVGHLPSYWSGYTKRYTPDKQNKPDDNDDDGEDKKDKELIAKYRKQVEKDRKKVAADQKKVSDARTKQHDDLKQQDLDQKAYDDQEKTCNQLKETMDNDDTDENKKNYAACKEKLAEDQATLDNDKDTIKKDTKNLKKQKKKLKKDQKTLKADKKLLEDEQKREAGDHKKGNDTAETNAGMQRMAATIREARDPFSSGGPPVHDKNIFNSDFKFENRDWRFGLGIDQHIGKVGALNFFIGLDSNGGSELRYKGSNYGWSALDTAVLEAAMEVQIKFEVKIFGIKIGIDIDDEIAIGIPTGGGGYQANDGSEGNTLTVLDMPPSLGYYGESKKDGKPKIYGTAGYPTDRWISWEGAAIEMEENTVKGSPYSGLKPYRDMTDLDPGESGYTMPFISPYFIVGVTRKHKDINKTGPKFSGNLNLLEEQRTIDRIGAIAKSELYFNRPTDVSHFIRHDNFTEKPNVFGPFWQARLSKTNDIDRFLALAIQHKTIWLSDHDAAEIPGMETIKSEIEKLLNLF